MDRRVRVRGVTLTAGVTAALAFGSSPVQTRGGPAQSAERAKRDLSIHITSPLGRTGGVGSVRIVAQVQLPSGSALGPVRFYVDNTLYKTDSDGPPYAVEWFDENPFERRELSVEAEDNLGNTCRDKVVLEPFEITEISEVASVLLEAGVYDRKGHFITGLKPTQFVVTEDGVAQTIDLVSHE